METISKNFIKEFYELKYLSNKKRFSSEERKIRIKKRKKQKRKTIIK
jgi:hypothetical protein